MTTTEHTEVEIIETNTEIEVIEPAGEIDRLGSLKATANQAHHDAEAQAGKALEFAWRAGQALIAVKEQLDHGKFGAWVDANFDATRRTAQMYMRLAENTQHVSDLDAHESIRGALKAIKGNDDKPKPEPKAKPIPTVETSVTALWDRTATMDDDERAEVADELNQLLGTLSTPDETGSRINRFDSVMHNIEPSEDNAGKLAAAITQKWGSWGAFDKARKAAAKQ